MYEIISGENGKSKELFQSENLRFRMLLETVELLGVVKVLPLQKIANNIMNISK